MQEYERPEPPLPEHVQVMLLSFTEQVAFGRWRKRRPIRFRAQLLLNQVQEETESEEHQL